MPKPAVTGRRLTMEQVCIVIDGKIDDGKIRIAKVMIGHTALSI
jgi:hypothetical protein